MKRKKKKSYPAEIQASVQHALSKQRMGLMQDAESIYRNILLHYPDHPDANHLYGVILFGGNNYEAAIKHIKKALGTHPKNPEYLHNLGIAYKESGLNKEAKKLFSLSVKADRKYSAAYNSLGSVYIDENQPVEAVREFKKAVKINPAYLDARYNLANAYMLSNEFEKAIHEYESLRVSNPNDEDTVLNLVNCYSKARSPEKAVQVLENVINSTKINELYIYKIAEIYEASSNLEKALEWIEKVREKKPANEKYIYLHAVIKRRTSQFKEAITLLQDVKLPLNDTSLTQKIYFELGRLHDRLGDYDNAFDNFNQGNQIQEYSADLRQANKERFLNHLQLVSNNISSEWLSSWTNCKPNRENQKVVFMVAFPRSGTTLLDQILDGHSQIQVMEEQPILGEIIADLVSKYDDYPNCLAQLSCQEIKKYRKYYMVQAAKLMELQTDSILIDKLPLNIVEIELIYRLFPESKIILSLRHPYDVCLSNFMQHFDLNDAMANFLKLEDAANAYRQVMELWQKYTEIMPLSYKSVRYEDLVESTETQARQLAEFLELEWEPSMLNHVQHARSRKIHTPSYQQVTEEIYTRSRYRWKNYEPQLDAISDDLKILIKSFGYEL